MSKTQSVSSWLLSLKPERPDPRHASLTNGYERFGFGACLGLRFRLEFPQQELQVQLLIRPSGSLFRTLRDLP